MQKKNNNNKINRVVSLVQWSRRPVLLLLVALFYRKWRRTSSAFFFVSIDFVDVLFLHRLFIIAVFFAGFCSVCFYLTEIDSTLFFSHFLSAKQLLIGSVPNFVFFFNIFLFNGVLALSLFYFVRHFRRSRCFARGFGTWTRERERERPTTSSPKMMASSAHLSFFLFFLSLSHSIPSSIQFSTSIVVAKRNTFIVRVFFLIGSLSLEWFDVKVAKKKRERNPKKSMSRRRSLIGRDPSNGQSTFRRFVQRGKTR